MDKISENNREALRNNIVEELHNMISTGQLPENLSTDHFFCGRIIDSTEERFLEEYGGYGNADDPVSADNVRQALLDTCRELHQKNKINLSFLNKEKTAEKPKIAAPRRRRRI